MKTYFLQKIVYCGMFAIKIFIKSSYSRSTHVCCTHSWFITPLLNCCWTKNTSCSVIWIKTLFKQFLSSLSFLNLFGYSIFCKIFIAFSFLLSIFSHFYPQIFKQTFLLEMAEVRRRIRLTEKERFGKESFEIFPVTQHCLEVHANRNQLQYFLLHLRCDHDF